MSENTSIQWTDATWNPVRGCSRVSEGCRHCYAERQAARFSGPGRPFDGFVRIQTGIGPQWTGKVELVEGHLFDPLKWREPRKVFVNSMSDLFHENLPDEAIDRVFAVMALAQARGHQFQVLTKRAGRMRDYVSAAMPRVAKLLEEELGPLPEGMIWPIRGLWLGVSVESDENHGRIWELLKTPAAIRFISYEPALGPLDLDKWELLCKDWRRGLTIGTYLDWVIVGGESGPGARTFDIAWARKVVAQCKAAGVACFVKQLGAHPQEEITVPRDGHKWNRPLPLLDRKGGKLSEWPEDLRVREFPA